MEMKSTMHINKLLNADMCLLVSTAYRILYKWFTALCSKGTPLIIERAKSFILKQE